MYSFPIGVITESFRLPVREAIRAAAALGADGIQMYAVAGETSAEALTKEKRRELLDFVHSNGLRFSFFFVDLGMGFGSRERNPELIERSKRILELAKDLETDVVTTHIGVVPSDPNHPRYGVMQEACFSLAQYADQLNAHFAVETGPEPAAVLKGFLDGLFSTGISVNLDPANLVMVAGDDPVRAVHTLRRYIVHTHAKDGVMLCKGDPEVIYRVTPPPTAAAPQEYFRELPLGQGNVDFPAYLRALEEIGYKGFLTIEREAGSDPAADIRTAKDYLQSIIAAN